MKLLNKTNKGFSLLESMIAVVVFSFGLLGVAGVMTVSVKNNHNGYMRSQAAFLASSMIDMMRNNQIALWNDLYNGTYSSSAALSSADNCSSTACSYIQLKDRDVQTWSNMIQQLLPNSEGEITCAATGAPITTVPIMIIDPLEPLTPTDVGYPSLPLIPCENCSIDPYNGFCTVTITWSEANQISSSSEQTFTLVGKP